MSLLTIRNVSGGYGEVDIISGIDMHVDPKEIVTIAGTNGAGKSTLIKALMGLLPRMSGFIQFDGIDLLKLGYRCVEHVQSPEATHVVLKK